MTRKIIMAAALAAFTLSAAATTRAQEATPLGPPEVSESQVPPESLTFAVHVGSYKLPGNAPVGWHKLADFWPGVLYFQRMTKEVDIPGKGHFMRLYLVGDPALAPVLCRELTKRGKYCQIHDLRAGAGVTLHDGEKS